MSESVRFTEEDFARFQEFFNTLPPEQHAKVVNDLIEQLYGFIRAYITILNPPENMSRPTSLANSYTYGLLEDYEKNVVGPFLNAKYLPQYLKYLQRGIFYFIHNKLTSFNSHRCVQLPIDPETGQEIDFPDDYQPDFFTLEVIQQLVDILYSKLNPDQRQLFEMRAGIRFVEKNGKIELVNGPKMTFPQIAEALGGGQTANTVGRRFSRLKRRLMDTEAIVLLFPEFLEDDLDEYND